MCSITGAHSVLRSRRRTRVAAGEALSDEVAPSRSGLNRGLPPPPGTGLLMSPGIDDLAVVANAEEIGTVTRSSRVDARPPTERGNTSGAASSTDYRGRPPGAPPQKPALSCRYPKS